MADPWSKSPASTAADTYRAAGGDCRYELFENSKHEWTGKPGPQATRAQEMVKAFIARNLAT